MTIVSAIIRDAYRESNLIAISADPTTAEQTEGLRLLNRFVLSLFGNEAGEKLITIPLGSQNVSRPSEYPSQIDQQDADWFVPLNTNLVLNLTSAQTVYLHPKPEDGSRFAFVDNAGNLSTRNLTVNGNGRTIDSLTTATFNTDSQTREYFFRADTGNWSIVSPLEVADSSPFPQQFDDLLIVGLAMRLNPRNGVAADQQSIDAYKMSLRKFKAQYNQKIETPSELALLRTRSVRRGNQLFDETDFFATGNPFPRW